jgi:hypothetical protein
MSAMHTITAMRLAIVLALCSLASALWCGLGFALLIGQAFGRRAQPGAKTFSQMILGVGIKFGGGNPALSYFLAWATWTAAFVGIVWALGGV